MSVAYSSGSTHCAWGAMDISSNGNVSSGNNVHSITHDRQWKSGGNGSEQIDLPVLSRTVTIGATSSVDINMQSYTDAQGNTVTSATKAKRVVIKNLSSADLDVQGHSVTNGFLGWATAATTVIVVRGGSAPLVFESAAGRSLTGENNIRLYNGSGGSIDVDVQCLLSTGA